MTGIWYLWFHKSASLSRVATSRSRKVILGLGSRLEEVNDTMAQLLEMPV